MRRPGTTTRAVALGLAIALLAACTNGDETSTTTTEVVAPGRPDVPTGEAVIAIGGGDRLLPEKPGEKVPGTDIRFPEPLIEGFAVAPDGTLYFYVGQYRGALYRYGHDGLVERVDVDVAGLGSSIGRPDNILTFGADGNLYVVHFGLIIPEWAASRIDADTGSVEQVGAPLQVEDNFFVIDFVVDANGQLVIAGGTPAPDAQDAVLAVEPDGVSNPLPGFTVPGCGGKDPAPIALALNAAGDLAMASAAAGCPAIFVRRGTLVEIVAGVLRVEQRLENITPCPDADEPFEPIALTAFGNSQWLAITRCPHLWLVADATSAPRPVASLSGIDGSLYDSVVSTPDGLAWIAGLDALYLVNPAV